METTIVPPLWAKPGWIDEVSAWIDAELARLGYTVIGPLQQSHLRPWSTVLRVPTADGALFFKANTPLIAFEPALAQMLYRLRPDLTLRVLAADPARGWMLLVDGGPRLREVIRADRDPGHWERLLPRYAELQIALAGMSPELLALGVPDRRMHRFPELIAELLDTPDKLRIGLPDGLSAEAWRGLRDEAPALTDLCQQLVSAGVPQSLHHGDFHDANIFAGDSSYRFFDWGDANLSHPFFSLRTVFVSVENSLQLEEGAPQFDRLRDAYLEPWTTFLPASELRSLFKIAAQVAPLSSVLGWNYGLSAADSVAAADFAHAIPALFQEYLDLQAGAAG